MTRNMARFDPREAAKFFFRHGHSGWLGLTYRDHGDDWVELELPWREDLLGEPDRPVLASGPIVSLMDMASGMSIWQKSGTFTPIATLDLRVDYQRPARERSAVFGRVECYRMTRSAAFVRGIAHDGDPDDPVAHVAGVFMTIASDPRQKDRTATESAKSEGDTDD
ncbi:PaaI family thioesterase [Erythrobacter sp. JK5]|uniref:PaaI family thioesterase n=1 Tax=Erythrobacter sp. JK5 TaxID=2829500 RepID=UPI0020121FD4|nr:PaaI family thioesterase [Erythrobacter sp. JK5]